MPTFKWSAKFETGLTSVDEQHRRLVDLINSLDELLNRDEVSDAEVESLFGELTDYADYHFAEEEALMGEIGLDARHFEGHIEKHRAFSDELLLLRENAGGDAVSHATEILDYLIHWLTYHILGQDQNMARQIHAMRGGQDAAAAFADGEQPEDRALEPLLDALNRLLARLSLQNRELKELNESLERRVAERTRALAEANEKLRSLSLTDALTGLPNRRHAMQQIELLWNNCPSAAGPLSLLMIDADHFKQVNDAHGHEAGDRLLVALARTFRDCVRTDDIVARLGGDEFLVICPDTDATGATRVAEQLHQRVADLRIPIGDDEFWSGSISVGLAVRAAAMEATAELIKAADCGLYDAKEAGRDCIRVAGGDAGRPAS